jgi:outer membrane protein assembly factor BamB
VRKALFLSYVLAACADAPPKTEPLRSPEPPRLAHDAPSVAPTAAATDTPKAKTEEPKKEGPAKERCGSGAWAMFGHDGARTSASDGCVEGALKSTWTFRPLGLCGYKAANGRVQHAVADGEAVFASGDCAGAPAVWRIDPAKGTTVWTMSRADYSRASWPALAGDRVVSSDDGVFFIDRATGQWKGRELDIWGESIVDGDRYFVDNTFQLDGAGPFVGSFDSAAKWVWKASVFYGGRGKNIADVGGIALSGGIIVHAAAAGPRGAPTLSAHDAENGERKWSAPGVWPESAPSIADGKAFTLERWPKENDDRLVARDLASGNVAWSVMSGWARGAPPAITPKLVIVHARDAVRAFDRSNGALVWSTPLPRSTPLVQSMTTLAVALGSDTVVVTTEARLAVLKLADGKEVWSGPAVTGNGAICGSPIVVGKSVYVAIRTLTNMGSLVRFDPQ